MTRVRRLMACAAASALAGCGGGGGTSSVQGSTITAGATPAASPAPSPSPAPVSTPAAAPLDIAPPAGVGLSGVAVAAAGTVQDLQGGSLAATADGSVWFSGGLAPNAIGRLSATGRVSYPVTGAAAAGSFNAGPLAVGADGNLWFCDPSAGAALQGAILTVDTATGLSVKYTPAGISAGAQAYAIVPGADGNLWFSEYNGARIGRFDPVRKLAAEFGPLTSRATAIAPGPDGAVWFAEAAGAGASILGRAVPARCSTGTTDPTNPTPVPVPPLPASAASAPPDPLRDFTDGCLTEFAGSPVAGTIAAITGGPDGRVWFVKNGVGGPAVGRFDPVTRAVTLYAELLGDFPQLSTIVAGPDGRLWFADYASGLIGRIGTDGTLVEFSSGALGAPFNAMAAGPAAASPHRVWFTRPADDSVGQITLP